MASTCSSVTMEPFDPSSESGSSSETESISKTTVSLLDRLKAPTQSELSTKGKILTNSPNGKKRSSGAMD